MAEIIRMPRLSDTMEEGNIVSWLKNEGDKVSPGDVLAEVETDKATMELESFFDGYLLYIGVKSGTVPVDGIIAIIGDKGEDFQSLLSGGNAAPKIIEEEQRPEPKKDITITPAPILQKEATVVVAEESSNNNNGRLKASPLAKSLASQAGVDITQVHGSGDSGRIIKRDIESFMNNPVQSTTSLPIKHSTAMGIMHSEEVPVTQMRKVIAKRLSESLFTAPHFYLTAEINMDSAIEARSALNESGDVKISFNDLVVKACALSLRKHPTINSSWMGDKILVHSHINIGVAVAVTDGLLVPVIAHTDYKSLSEINTEVKSLAAKAKEKKLQPNEMSGNTFTISNLGMFDIDEFTAIINPPDACILAVGSIQQKPIVKNGSIVVGNIMKVTLSCDHRVVDGASGAQFLQTLRHYLENPVRMLA